MTIIFDNRNSTITAGNAKLINEIVTLNYSSTVTTDLSTGNIFRLNLTGNVILANPINGVDGRAYTWWIKQDGSARSITLGDNFIIPASATLPLSWSSGGNKMDILVTIYDGVNEIFLVVSMIPGYNVDSTGFHSSSSSSSSSSTSYIENWSSSSSSTSSSSSSSSPSSI